MYLVFVESYFDFLNIVLLIVSKIILHLKFYKFNQMKTIYQNEKNYIVTNTGSNNNLILLIPKFIKY